MTKEGICKHHFFCQMAHAKWHQIPEADIAYIKGSSGDTYIHHAYHLSNVLHPKQPV